MFIKEIEITVSTLFSNSFKGKQMGQSQIENLPLLGKTALATYPLYIAAKAKKGCFFFNNYVELLIFFLVVKVNLDGIMVLYRKLEKIKFNEESDHSSAFKDNVKYYIF